jgi:circadian clock protein KaiB
MKRQMIDTAPARSAVRSSVKKIYDLQLYVTGTTPRSARCIVNLLKFCERRLAGRYKLKIIDIYQQPELARGEQIIAAPTLIKKFPLPLRKLVGDFSDQERIRVGLGLRAEPEA